GWRSRPRSSSADAPARTAAGRCGSCAPRTVGARGLPRGNQTTQSRLVEEGMDGAVLGIEHFLALIDLQRDADITRGKQWFEVRPGSGEQGLAGALFYRDGASSPHAQVEIHEGVVTQAVGHSVVGRGIREYPYTPS